ncbi:MAG TPA: hypothetical protein DD614_02630 [Clostridiales bacterium]|nr:hypothetical protein [Clostridiales bacterium]
MEKDFVRKDTQDNFVTEKMDIIKNNLLGEYDDNGNYYIAPQIVSELIELKKVRKSSYNNSMFCCGSLLGYGEIMFEITFDNSRDDDDMATSSLFVLEEVEKVNGYLQNIIKTKIAEFKSTVDNFLDESYSKFHVTDEDEEGDDEGKEKKSLEDLNIEDSYILAKKAYMLLLSKLSEEKMLDAYGKYFTFRLSKLTKLDNEFSNAVLNSFNERYALIEEVFLKEKNYKALNELLDACIEEISGTKEIFIQQEAEFNVECKDALDTFTESVTRFSDKANAKAFNMLDAGDREKLDQMNKSIENAPANADNDDNSSDDVEKEYKELLQEEMRVSGASTTFENPVLFDEMEEESEGEGNEEESEDENESTQSQEQDNQTNPITEDIKPVNTQELNAENEQENPNIEDTMQSEENAENKPSIVDTIARLQEEKNRENNTELNTDLKSKTPDEEHDEINNEYVNETADKRASDVGEKLKNAYVRSQAIFEQYDNPKSPQSDLGGYEDTTPKGETQSKFVSRSDGGLSSDSKFGSMFDNLANNQNSSTKFDDTNNSKMAGQPQTGDATTSSTSYSTTDETLITSDTSNNFDSSTGTGNETSDANNFENDNYKVDPARDSFNTIHDILGGLKGFDAGVSQDGNNAKDYSKGNVGKSESGLVSDSSDESKGEQPKSDTREENADTQSIESQYTEGTDFVSGGGEENGIFDNAKRQDVFLSHIRDTDGRDM